MRSAAVNWGCITSGERMEKSGRSAIWSLEMPGYGEVDRDATMELGKIRTRYPDLIVWTNVSVDLLHRGSPEEVYEDSMQILDESGGRGYLHGASNAVLPNTPPENVWAMMEALGEYNRSSSVQASVTLL